jgi:hypothetical protein
MFDSRLKLAILTRILYSKRQPAEAERAVQAAELSS